MIRYYCEGCNRALSGPGDLRDGDAHEVIKLDVATIFHLDSNQPIPTKSVTCGRVVAIMPVSRLRKVIEERNRITAQNIIDDLSDVIARDPTHPIYPLISATPALQFVVEWLSKKYLK